mmetsp:Transcript_51134/g.94653  ORF Transcript_51134/g.94653 Transcript_51134/m.94653 type:complete len:228 (+) Transcript_51134:575-1258(+)
MAFCLKSALSSKFTLASHTSTRPSDNSARGLISSMVQSHAMKTLYKLAMSVPADLACGPTKPMSVAIWTACCSEMPSMMSTGALMMALGSLAAISSMDVPPVLLPIMRGPPLPRSIKMAKYFSVAIETFSAKSNVLFGLPSAPVCLVMSVLPSIFSAVSFTLSLATMCTPPWKLFSLKYPKPRPPAKTCAFTTTSSPGSSVAFCAASSAENAGKFLGTPTPKSAKIF